MNRMDETFSRGLRDALIREVEATRTGSARRRRRWQIGAGFVAVAALAGGAGAATAGFFHVPGSDIVTSVADPAEGTYTGSAVIDLGPPPEQATHILVELTCVSAGTVYWEDGSSMICSGNDASSMGGQTLTLTPEKRTTEIQADDDVQYRAKVTYVNQTPTEWAVNENGDTYGGAKDSTEPDLQAVFATNGKMGYAYTTELRDAGGSANFTSPEEALAWQESMKGKTVTVPVYESDGETVIGEFVVGSW